MRRREDGKVLRRIIASAVDSKNEPTEHRREGRLSAKCQQTMRLQPHWRRLLSGDRTEGLLMLAGGRELISKELSVCKAYHSEPNITIYFRRMIKCLLFSSVMLCGLGVGAILVWVIYTYR